jgi:hypothetical protein
VLDGAGWHTAPGLVVPEGIRLVYLPPPDRVRGRLYTPELQPAETLWVHVDEPIVNKHFETIAELDTAVAAQCVALNATAPASKARQVSTGGRSASPRTDQPEIV